MARKEIIVMVCDKCGTEDTDTTRFRHVTVSQINTKKPYSSRDLCEECLGMPGVNRDA